MSVNAWKTGSRYNALHLSKKMIPIIYALQEAELIDLAKGSYGKEGAKGNRTTRIRASETLQEWFSAAKFVRNDVDRAENEEVIILKDENKKPVEYVNTPDSSRMRKDLRAYNDLIAGSTCKAGSISPCQVTQYPSETIWHDCVASSQRIRNEPPVH